MTGADLASILRGDPATGDDLRAALAEMRDAGYFLIHREKLEALHRAVTFRDLSVDTALLVETIVESMWDENGRRRRAAA